MTMTQASQFAGQTLPSRAHADTRQSARTLACRPQALWGKKSAAVADPPLARKGAGGGQQVDKAAEYE